MSKQITIKFPLRAASLIILAILLTSLVAPIIADTGHGDGGTYYQTQESTEDGPVGYRIDGDVVEIWNPDTIYYFNKSSGIQWSEDPEQYWSRNIFAIGYYSGGEWHKIYRADELGTFNREIDSDYTTYVNATLWKDFTYAGYNLRLGVRYHLKVDDTELSVIIYAKNIGTEDYPAELGFAWMVTDIDIPNPLGEDKIYINQTYYRLDDEHDLTFRNMSHTYFNHSFEDPEIGEWITEFDPHYRISDYTQFITLEWAEDILYAVRLQCNGNLQDAKVTWMVNAGIFEAGQEKFTTLYWADAEGDYIDSWDTSGQTTVPFGIATDGTNIWVVDDTTDEVYKYTMAGVYTTEHWDTGAADGSRGITTDGTNIWILDGPDLEVYKYNMVGGYIGSWDISGQIVSPSDITTDGTNIWIVDAFLDEVFKYNMAGGYIDSWATTAANGVPRGIATDGTNIWIGDRADDEVYKYTMAGVYTTEHWDTSGQSDDPEALTTDGINIWLLDYADNEVYKYEGPPPAAVTVTQTFLSTTTTDATVCIYTVIQVIIDPITTVTVTSETYTTTGTTVVTSTATCTTTCETSIQTSETCTTTCETSETCTTICETSTITDETCITTCETSTETSETCTTTCETSTLTSETCTTTCDTSVESSTSSTTTCDTSVDSSTSSTTICDTSISSSTSSTTTCTSVTDTSETTSTTCITSVSTIETCTTTCDTSIISSTSTSCITTTVTHTTECITTCETSTETSVTTTCITTCETSETTTTMCSTLTSVTTSCTSTSLTSTELTTTITTTVSVDTSIVTHAVIYDACVLDEFDNDDLVAWYNNTHRHDSIVDILHEPALEIPDGILTLVGTLDSGNLASVQTFDDVDSYNVSEAAGAPGFDIRFNFTGLTDTYTDVNCSIYVWYDGGAGHTVEVQTWNYTSGTWIVCGVITEAADFGWFNFSRMGAGGDLVRGGILRGRIVHTSPGNINHDIYIDYIELRLDICPCGQVFSENILEGLNATAIVYFRYNITITPYREAFSRVVFSQDNTTWVDSGGIAQWEEMVTGDNSILLTGLDWAGNFYYRIWMHKDVNGTSPTLDLVQVCYSTIPAGGGWNILMLPLFGVVVVFLGIMLMRKRR